jgi:hypothetical protein
MQNVTNWEYRDFVYPIAPGGIWANCGRLDHPDILSEIFFSKTKGKKQHAPYTLDQAREIFWREYRQEIVAALQPWIDNGWEPGDEMSSAGIALRTYKSFKTYPTLRPLLIVLSIVTIGLPLFWRNTVAEPMEFRLSMRRTVTLR